MAVSYPHKQTILIAIVCMIAVLGTVIYVDSQNAPQNIDTSVAVSSVHPQIGAISTSSPDAWKKQFFNQSTGTSTVISLNRKASLEASTSQTLTNQISQELFARFIELKQNNLDSNPQLVQDTIDQTLSNAASAASQAKQYATTDVSVIDQPTNADIHSYGNSVGALLLRYMPKDNAPTIAENAFEQSDLTQLAAIDPLIASYKTLIQSLLSLKVPKSLVGYHIGLVNSISGMLFVSQQLRNIEGDPAQSILALGTFTSAQDAMRASMLGIKDYLSLNGIAFASSEPGSVFATITP